MTEWEGLVRVIPVADRRERTGRGFEGVSQSPRSTLRYPPRIMPTASWTRRIVWPRIEEVFQT
jgi:hypothetical protein